MNLIEDALRAQHQTNLNVQRALKDKGDWDRICRKDHIQSTYQWWHNINVFKRNQKTISYTGYVPVVTDQNMSNMINELQEERQEAEENDHEE